MSTVSSPLLQRISLLNETTLLAEYDRDITINDLEYAQPIFLETLHNDKLSLSKEITDKNIFLEKNGYCSYQQDIIFTLPKRLYPMTSNHSVYLACPLNNWGDALLSPQWKLRPIVINGNHILGLIIPAEKLPKQMTFKFITDNGLWISPDDSTSNVVIDDKQCRNFSFNADRTGNHYLQYHLSPIANWHDTISAQCSDGKTRPVDMSEWISNMYSDTTFGATILKNMTTFRLFAPRAKNVRVSIFHPQHPEKKYFTMQPQSNGVWYVAVPKILHKYYYQYQLLFDHTNDWSSAITISDPYAKATTQNNTIGIILKERCFRPLLDHFIPPQPKDAVILEAHLRDILAKTDYAISPSNRLHFSGLRKYLKKANCYLRVLGTNVVELQPIQEFDYNQPSDYHWGYMPSNWFAPSSTYTAHPERGQQVKEFKKLIKAFHQAGIAVILDVVYNHLGESHVLQKIDIKYYCRHNDQQYLLNYSGCGNDTKSEHPMTQRIIIDSLKHLVKTYNVDGFRFDLAELLDRNLLNNLQKELKSIKQSLLFIAEPWSFRSNAGIAMNTTQYSLWNDEYREFVKEYVRGNGNSEGLRYFLCGSLDFRSTFPSQSVNYVASHDDRGWVDNITENPHNNGNAPTENDCRRTHLSAAIMMMSVGIPMLTAGQDFLFSKQGISNTYNRGDINALDYNRLKQYHNTHKYFRRLIKLRLSKRGDVIRLSSIPAKSYFRIFTSNNSACAMVYNADKSLDRPMMIFAINPHNATALIDFDNIDVRRCRMLADERRVFTMSKRLRDEVIDNKLVLPPMSCRIFSLK